MLSLVVLVFSGIGAWRGCVFSFMQEIKEIGVINILYTFHGFGD